MKKNWEFDCRIVSWIDGDTVDVEADLGFRIFARIRVRVHAINCPEIHSKDPVERQAGLYARDKAAALAPVGSEIAIRSFKDANTEKYGRWLGIITLSDSADFATCMVESGHAKAWDGTGARPI